MDAKNTKPCANICVKLMDWSSATGIGETLKSHVKNGRKRATDQIHISNPQITRSLFRCRTNQITGLQY